MTKLFTIKHVVFKIDDADSDLLTHRWKLLISNKDKSSEKFYASRNVTKAGVYVGALLMHRVIMGRVLNRDLDQEEHVDHIDGDSTNNQRENLRVATRAQNAANRKRRVDNKTGFKGVTKRKNSNRYDAAIWINQKQVHLGRFDTPEEAHEAYLKAAGERYGEFARGE